MPLTAERGMAARPATRAARWRHRGHERSFSAGANVDSGSAELEPETEALLGVARATLTRDPTLGMEIAGHTDANGGDRCNQRLSEARAQSIADFLIGAGIAPERSRTIGCGETRRIASNDTKERREANRRVESRSGPWHRSLPRTADGRLPLPTTSGGRGRRATTVGRRRREDWAPEAGDPDRFSSRSPSLLALAEDGAR